MNVTIFGTGNMARAIATRMLAGGNSVTFLSRTPDKSAKIAQDLAPHAKKGATIRVAALGSAIADPVVINTIWFHSAQDVIKAHSDQLKGKILVDVTNPLDFSHGMPPSLTVANTGSMAERLQAALPETKVVKALNTLSSLLMVGPASLPGEHNLFIAGNDPGAKVKVKALLHQDFGWPEKAFLDLGDLSAARGMEATLLLWVRLYGALGHANFNWHINIGPAPQA